MGSRDELNKLFFLRPLVRNPIESHHRTAAPHEPNAHPDLCSSLSAGRRVLHGGYARMFRKKPPLNSIGLPGRSRPSQTLKLRHCMPMRVSRLSAVTLCRVRRSDSPARLRNPATSRLSIGSTCLSAPFAVGPQRRFPHARR
jgi:hypothetical protein